MKARFQKFSHYKDIVLFRTLANIKADHSKTYLGYLWLLIEPLLNTAIMYLVFAVILKAREPNYIIFLLVGTSVWQWYATTVTLSMGTIADKVNVLREVYLPKYIFPLVIILANTWKFLCIFLVILLGCLFFGGGLSIYYLYLPLLLFIVVLLITAIALPLSIIAVYFSDIRTAMAAVFRGMMFLSGIFFSGAVVPDHLKLLFYANPMAGMIDCFRAVLIDAQAPSLGIIAYNLAIGLLGLIPGLWWMNRIDLEIIKHAEPS